MCSIEEEIKEQESLGFNDSSLQAIEKKEEPYVEMRKQLKRNDNISSHRELPARGLFHCGSS